MPTYYVSINEGYPHTEYFKDNPAPFASKEDASAYIEGELDRLYPGQWDRNTSSQWIPREVDYAGRYPLAALAIYFVHFTAEEKERAELAALPGEIAKLQTRLAELQAKYSE